MKNHFLKILLFSISVFQLEIISFTQQNEKIWFDGLGRSYFSRDNVVSNGDTISPNNMSGGYNLIDLNVHVNPIPNIEVFGQVRVQNQFGGFFGSGTQIDVRQLTARGTLKNKIKFSVGDIYLKQNRFTLYNYDEDLNLYKSDFYNSYKSIIDYENFYEENRWRLQGLQVDFSYKFDRFIRTLEFDFFTTRPRGSSQINSALNTFQSDMLLSGATIYSKISNSISAELNYSTLNELPNSGTQLKSVKNPVYQIGLIHKHNTKKFNFNSKIQAGFSERSWSHKVGYDSISHRKLGMFFEYKSELSKLDTLFNISWGSRYVDPNFRSSAAQSRRIDMTESNLTTIYTTYSNDAVIRPISVFDIITDQNIYNQNISPTLMNFNPIFSNALPYGDATPNRIGVFLKGFYKNKKKYFDINFSTSFFSEVIGQGTSRKRTFLTFSQLTKVYLNEIFNHKKEFNFSLGYLNQITNREGDSIEFINLNSNHIDFKMEKELLDKVYFNFSTKRVKALGNEYLTVRDGFDEIITFQQVDYNRIDYLHALGIKYQFKKDVYIDIQYNFWGSEFNRANFNDFDFQRLLFIFSIKL